MTPFVCAVVSAVSEAAKTVDHLGYGEVGVGVVSYIALSFLREMWRDQKEKKRDKNSNGSSHKIDEIHCVVTAEEPDGRKKSWFDFKAISDQHQRQMEQIVANHKVAMEKGDSHHDAIMKVQNAMLSELKGIRSNGNGRN
jgi:bifunctional pyridoxal-dependent enzyme with beta-cystathionase and maltose regulon repressor activities